MTAEGPPMKRLRRSDNIQWLKSTFSNNEQIKIEVEAIDSPNILDIYYVNRTVALEISPEIGNKVQQRNGPTGETQNIYTLDLALINPHHIRTEQQYRDMIPHVIGYMLSGHLPHPAVLCNDLTMNDNSPFLTLYMLMRHLEIHDAMNELLDDFWAASLLRPACLIKEVDFDAFLELYEEEGEEDVLVSFVITLAGYMILGDNAANADSSIGPKDDRKWCVEVFEMMPATALSDKVLREVASIRSKRQTAFAHDLCEFHVHDDASSCTEDWQKRIALLMREQRVIMEKAGIELDQDSANGV